MQASCVHSDRFPVSSPETGEPFGGISHHDVGKGKVHEGTRAFPWVISGKSG